MHNALWDNLVPYLKKETCNSAGPYQIADIAAILTTLSLKPCFNGVIRNRAVELFTYFITSDTIDIRYNFDEILYRLFRTIMIILSCLGYYAVIWDKRHVVTIYIIR